MTKGPQELRLDQALAGAAEPLVQTAIDEWYDGAALLGAVERALLNAKPLIADQFGPDTSDAAATAFQKMADKVAERREQMNRAGQALSVAKGALVSAQAVRASLGGAPSPPGEFRADPDADEVDQLRAHRAHAAQVQAYNAAVAEREQQAREAADHMDRVYRGSTETMREVHGEPDAARGGGSAGGGGAGAGGGTAATGGGAVTAGGGTTRGDGGHHVVIGSSPGPAQVSGPGGSGHVPGHLPSQVTGAGVPQGPGETAPAAAGGPTTPIGASAAGGPTGATVGGLAGALGGGLVGGMAGITGAVRGGGVSAAAAGNNAAQARPIGSSSRTATSGALGRSTPVPGAPTTRAAGAAPGSGGASRSAGGGAGGGGARAAGGGAPGSRGRSGGRATGARAGAVVARGGPRKRTEDKPGEQEFFEDAQDWIDDEDGAPGVLG